MTHAVKAAGVNQQVLLTSRPEGIPQAEHFTIAERPVPALGAPEKREVLIRNEWLAVEPAMRGWVNAVANYSEPVAIGAVMRAFAAGRVVASNDPRWKVGDAVTGLFGWQDYALVGSDVVERRIEEDDLPMSTALGVLGINGLTAHHGLLAIGQPKAGETVVVSTAAGAVGACVGQIAKTLGCRTVGITGGETKRKLCLERFGYDAAVPRAAVDSLEDLKNSGSPRRRTPYRRRRGGGWLEFFRPRGGPARSRGSGEAPLVGLARSARESSSESSSCTRPVTSSPCGRSVTRMFASSSCRCSVP